MPSALRERKIAKQSKIKRRQILKAGVLIPCCVDQFSPGTASRMVKLLERCGVDCHYPEAQTCCGKALYEAGDPKAAMKLGGNIIDLFKRDDYVVCCGSGCVAYMKSQFDNLFFNSAYHIEYPQFIAKLYDVSDFLSHVVEYVPPEGRFEHTVAYVDHGATLRDYRLREEPRRLLARVPGVQPVELPDPEFSAGEGLVFNNYFEAVAGEMARRKLQAAVDAGADVLTSSDPELVLHLRSYARKHGFDIRCHHLVDILYGLKG